MLKEIHHRVKNNLQIVRSLLRLQAREINDPNTIEQFGEATNRISAMSLIHDKMYQSADLAKIDFRDYLDSLIEDLIKSYAIKIPIQKSVNSSIELISPKFLVSIALLFNELVTNSLKHGFKNTDQGKIDVNITIIDQLIVLSYFDNGIWITPYKNSSFGTELIESLADQLDGTYTRTLNNGTLYTFTFPYNPDSI
jgi:two-component sensor histidine kinase